MKKKIKVLSISFIAIISLVACSSIKTNTEAYKGNKLTIAVVGAKPKINEGESIINFKNISLEDINHIDSKSYDAVIISKNYLSQAANKKYRSTYLKSSIPFFFTESKASVLPFVDNSLTYEQYADRVNDKQDYITGLLGASNNQYKTWQYGYNIMNNKIDRTNVKHIYSQVFKTIEKVKKEKRS
ncbi:hypothetical protein P4629_26410 [Priestia aryabhattai]|uniref:hypothetical protein n=1 Tax=Priestia aryabhattai TaxID=412384 RepID=UPI000BF321E0|nr:hypothetical protein [Priestia aryabhattai]MED4008914.1 hypothetical protein [Priestia aryabhattai]PGA17711.1 hypothetical protein COL65_15065 [Priestia aryabhattai]